MQRSRRAVVLISTVLACAAFAASAGSAFADTGRVTGGQDDSCAIKAGGAPACWGFDLFGQVTLPPDIGTVTQIAAGDRFTCAIKTGGTPACWGAIGAIPAGIGSVTQIAAGAYHACAIKTGGAPVCWGADGGGQSSVPAGTGTVTQISAGESHTCAVKTGGTPVCWGADGSGQSTIPGGIGAVAQIAAGGSHTCVIKTGGTPACWGDFTYGQSTVPAAVGNVTQIVAGDFHSCAIETGGDPVCWGDNTYGERVVPADLGTVTEIAVGGAHTCAIETGGTIACWGSDERGQLGGAPAVSSDPPPARVGAGPFSHTYIADAAAGLAARFVVSSGTLPPGLTLDGTTGVLAGTPTSSGTYTGVVAATNDLFAPVTQAFSITVDLPPPDAPTDLTPSPGSQVPAPPGPPAPPAPPAPPTPPLPTPPAFSFGAVKLSGSSVSKKRTATLAYTLSAAAKVKLVVASGTRGRMAKGTCAQATKKNRRGRSCTRYVTKATLALTGKAGKNTVIVSAKIGRKLLVPGSYRLTLTATPVAGGAQTKAVVLKVKRT